METKSALMEIKSALDGAAFDFVLTLAIAAAVYWIVYGRNKNG